MIRRVNFTGRKKIPRSRVAIRVREGGAARLFDADLRLDGLGLDADAQVFVEAYHRSAYLRFDFGTIARIQPPPIRRLDRIPVDRPLFRVKVVETAGAVGRIVAAADKIVPLAVDRDEENRDTLLFAEHADLGDRVWTLDLDGDWPTLYLNTRIEGIREAARAGPEFLTLVYPEVVRAVLTRVLRGERHTDPDSDEEDWPALWLRYAMRALGRPRPPADPDDPDVGRWIEDAVNAFCGARSVLATFRKLVEERRA